MQKVFKNYQDWFDFEKNKDPYLIWDRLQASDVIDTRISFNIKSIDKIFIRQIKLPNNPIQRIIIVFMRVGYH